MAFSWRSLVGACAVSVLLWGPAARAQDEDEPAPPPAAPPEPPKAADEPAEPAAPEPPATAEPAPSADPTPSADPGEPAKPEEPPAKTDPETAAPAPAVDGQEPDDAPGGDEYDLQDAKDAGYEVGDATADPSEGLGIDGKDYELDAELFAGMEGLDAADLEALTEVTPAELGEVDMDGDMGDAAEEQLEEQAEAIAGLDPEDLDKLAKMFVDVLRKKLHEVRDQQYDKTAAKIQASTDKRIGTMAGVLGWLSLSGLFLLFLPLIKGKKYPGQMGKFFAASALAAASLTAAILMLSGVMLSMRVVQGTLGEATNPQLVIQDAMFDGIDDNLEDIAATPGLLLMPLQQVASGEEEDIGVAVLNNVMQFKEDFDAFQKVAEWLKGIKGVFGYVPIVMTGLAIVLFLVSIKDLIRDVSAAPERAVRGEIPQSAVIGLVGRRVLNEVLATLGTLVVLFAITLLVSFALAFVAYPAMSMFVVELMATLQYVFVEPGASKAYVYIALLGVLVFLVLAVVSIIATSTLYVGKIQGILRARLNNGVPLGKHKRFFGWQTAALLWNIAMPCGLLVGVAALADVLAEKGTSGAEFDWSLALLPAPLGLVLGFLLVFLLGYGLKGLLSIAKYKPAALASDTALEQVAQALPQR